MNHQLDLASVAAPQADFDVFPFMNRLKLEAAGQPPSALLQRFHDALLARFPDSPWQKEYAGDHGRLTLAQRAHDVIPHILHLAAELGLTVVDKKSAEVHRPPTYQVVLEGASEGVDPAEAAARLAALMKQPVDLIQSLLSSGRRPVVKKGITRDRALQYIAALRERGGCSATMVLEPGAVERPEPPAPPAPKVQPVLAEAVPAAAAPVAATLAAPLPEVADILAMEQDHDKRLYEIAEGVRLLCIAFGLNFLMRKPLADLPLLWSTLCSGILMALQLYGSHRLAKAMGFPIAGRLAVYLLPAAAIPAFMLARDASSPALLLVSAMNVLFTLYLAVAGVRALKRDGLKVGLFGASKADVRALGGMQENEKLGSTLMAWAAFGLIFFIYMAGSRAGAARPDMPTVGELPCPYVGQWVYKRENSSFVFDMRLEGDGNYTAYLPGDTPKSTSGIWRVKNGTLQLKDMSGAPAEISRIALGEDGASFTLTVGSVGAELPFQLVQRLPAARCKY